MPSYKALQTERGCRRILDSMSKSLEGAKPYGVGGWTTAVGSL